MIKKILWLPSWYPNRTAPFDGDFIQRMAKATAQYQHVFVLYIVREENLRSAAPVNITTNNNANLTEQILYYRSGNRLSALYQYFKLYRRLIKNYIREYGKPDYVHIQVPIKAGLLALWVKRKFNIPYVLTEHYGIYNDIVDDSFKNRHFFFRHYTRKVIRMADKFQTVSRYIGERINEIVINKPFTVVYNTVDTTLFEYSPAKNNVFRFLHVSNMIPLKNVEGILRAISALYQTNQNFELFLIGPYPPHVYAAAEKTGLLNKAIFFIGEISYAEVAGHMKQAHSLILFSDIENMPCVILEALCCGLPVIATRVGGIPEVVNFHNGILIRPRDEAALVEAMSTMMNQYKQFDPIKISGDARQLSSYETIGLQISNGYQ